VGSGRKQGTGKSRDRKARLFRCADSAVASTNPSVVCYTDAMSDIEESCGSERAERRLMTPQQRWEESDKLWGV
jgi:hypothetical protein